VCGKERHKEKKLQRSLKKESPPTTDEEMYELMSQTYGRFDGIPEVKEFMDLFHSSKEAGMDARLRQLAPQVSTISNSKQQQQQETMAKSLTDVLQADSATTTEDAEDISPMEIAHLYELLKEKPDATIQEAAEVVASIKDICRSVVYTPRMDLSTVGMDGTQGLPYNEFKKLLDILAALMRIDKGQILACMAWAHHERFEMTEGMAEALMEKVFLKNRPAGGYLLEVGIKLRDFMPVCEAAGLIAPPDEAATSSLPIRPALEILFSSVIRHMPELRSKSEEKRFRHQMQQEIQKKTSETTPCA
jgi:hypothetical protein